MATENLKEAILGLRFLSGPSELGVVEKFQDLFNELDGVFKDKVRPIYRSSSFVKGHYKSNYNNHHHQHYYLQWGHFDHITEWGHFHHTYQALPSIQKEANVSTRLFTSTWAWVVVYI
ncbi:hypothetical protein O6H91_21G021900 [Diphasiastrum complanatum]|uniref:Uncharacterized protein n=1 Tax=Diphasiastrum complanatum TaxID=34168 RepID=A0ACC2AIP2_DIPCM|nr:hypothetical protein O6H91_21G021900 [Diphasiastrum complanatum]